MQPYMATSPRGLPSEINVSSELVIVAGGLQDGFDWSVNSVLQTNCCMCLLFERVLLLCYEGRFWERFDCMNQSQVVDWLANIQQRVGFIRTYCRSSHLVSKVQFHTTSCYRGWFRWNSDITSIHCIWVVRSDTVPKALASSSDTGTCH